MSENESLIPALETVNNTVPMKPGRPTVQEQKGHSYTIYLTPAEKQLLDYLGKKYVGPKKGLSSGIRFLIGFFSENYNK